MCVNGSSQPGFYNSFLAYGRDLALPEVGLISNLGMKGNPIFQQILLLCKTGTQWCASYCEADK